MAIKTPSDLRLVRGSTLKAEATSMVAKGNVDSANAKQTAFIHHGGTSGDGLHYAHMMQLVKELHLNCF
jgi:hypothetical protein